MVIRHDTDQGLRWQVLNDTSVVSQIEKMLDLMYVYVGGWGAGTQQAFCTPGVGGNS